MTITVTSAHIAAGVKGSACDCPVALALRDVFPTAPVIAVCHVYTRVGYQRTRTVQAVYGFMRAFDQGLRPPPFSFELGELVDA